ncbi:hypothetical protein QBC35DRAFT_219804 [Podospora australis]|uniref:NmrA-like domain-containing protein n=1 Tax=Podospora australis TaxID=1536484 RepID=A0AAN6WUA4_9PEZI|nr:hypothetical protein QBC35DRAFT_219804 [Podospora australis]
MSSARNILVVGATGKQGGAVVKALLDLPKSDTPLHILALTRNAQSPKAQQLAEAHPGVVEPVQGDSSHPNPIFESRPKGSINAIFIVTSPPMGGSKINEEEQAIPLIDSAVDHGVQHIVFSSVDRGGDEKSWTNPTDVQHFSEKHNIEIYLRDKAEKEKGKFTWTILRPVAFMENWTPGFFAAGFSAMWASALKPTTKLQLVSVVDIGKFAAKALTEPSEWAGRAVGLAGDELTLDEAKEVFLRATGEKLPQTWGILGKGMLWMIKEIGAMFRWFEEEGYGADIEARRKEISTQNFETWLKDSSNWVKE